MGTLNRWFLSMLDVFLKMWTKMNQNTFLFILAFNELKCSQHSGNHRCRPTIIVHFDFIIIIITIIRILWAQVIYSCSMDVWFSTTARHFSATLRVFAERQTIISSLPSLRISAGTLFLLELPVIIFFFCAQELKK